MGPPHSIDAIVAKLTRIIDVARDDRSRIGYFAAMYRKVTLSVKAAIEAGEFEDTERMTRLMVVFAQRYIDAVETFRDGDGPTEAWRVSFEANRRWRPIVVQQLLTGMSAHINLDLGIAAATVCPGLRLEPLRSDFDKVNDILATMIDGFVSDVAAVSPWVGLLDRLGARADDVLVEFSIIKARDAAWRLATQLAPLEPLEQGSVIAARDGWTARFGRTLLSPGFFLGLGLLLVRLRETNDVVRVIDALSDE